MLGVEETSTSRNLERCCGYRHFQFETEIGRRKNNTCMPFSVTVQSIQRMPNAEKNLLFEAICSLLDELESLLNLYRAPKSKLKKRNFKARQRDIVERWATEYNASILKDNQSVLAVLSLLFPDLRSERVFTMKEHVLSKVVSTALGMSEEASEKLRKNWRLQEKDFGTAVEKIMKGRVYL
jgi:hypothetical protein